MSFENQGKDIENLADVDLAQNLYGGSHFFIEGASKTSVIVSYVMLASFFLMHLYACIRAPPTLASKEEFFKLNSTQDNVSMDIDITLSQLQPLHRFVDVNGSFIRKDLQATRSISIEYTSRISYLKNYNVINSESFEKKIETIVFDGTNNKSSTFPVIHKTIGDFDSIQLKMTITTNYQDIDGFYFNWAFSNPSAEKYNKSARLLMSFLVGYMLVVFIFYLKFDAESFTQIFCIVLGITGIFASNPISLLLPETSNTSVADNVLMSVFLNVYKVFIIVELELLRTHRTKPATSVLISLAAVFGFIATIEAAATYDRAVFITTVESEIPTLFTTEKVMVFFNFLFAVGIVAELVFTYLQNAGSNPRRVTFFTVVVATTSLSMLFSCVYCPLSGSLMFTIKPSLLYISIFITNAAFSLFLLHPGSGLEYSKMEGGNDDTAPMVVDVDQLSADENDDDDDDDDDEDEEEEEEEEEE